MGARRERCEFGGGDVACRLLEPTAVVGQGEARTRQLRWVVGELHRWAPGVDCVEILDGDLSSYLSAAEAGKLRARAPAGPRAASAASNRVRVQCLAQLCRTGGRDVMSTSPPTPAAVPTAANEISLLLDSLDGDLSGAGRRAAAVAHLARHGLPVSSIAALRTGQVDGTRLRSVSRRGPGPTGVQQGDVALAGPAARALRSWLEVRDVLLVSDRFDQVFLTLAGARTAAGPHAAGYPVSARSLDREHRKAVQAHLLSRNPQLAEPLAPSALSLTRLADGRPRRFWPEP